MTQKHFTQILRNKIKYIFDEFDVFSVFAGALVFKKCQVDGSEMVGHLLVVSDLHDVEFLDQRLDREKTLQRGIEVAGEVDVHQTSEGGQFAVYEFHVGTRFDFPMFSFGCGVTASHFIYN